jgi:hypothetical protein
MYQVVEEVMRDFCIGKKENFTILKCPIIIVGWKRGSAPESEKRK